MMMTAEDQGDDDDHEDDDKDDDGVDNYHRSTLCVTTMLPHKG